MINKKFAAVAMLVAIPVTALGATAGAAFATDTASGGPQAVISAHVSDATPASGQAFHVSGMFTEGGKPAGEEVVKVQAKQPNGTWKNLPGARELTSSKGTYDLEVILNAKGSRDLRVVGVGLDTLPNALQTFAVKVH